MAISSTRTFSKSSRRPMLPTPGTTSLSFFFLSFFSVATPHSLTLHIRPLIKTAADWDRGALHVFNAQRSIQRTLG